MAGRCNKRTVWVGSFLLLLVLAFTAHLLAVLTPTWQYVYLEDGRTEHHHGLWLDCKRDYSNEYGKPREYYETLYRIKDLQGPFDQFWLPPLQCVFKFDYWIDDEDWYEHGYDENRLWGDAYQHLFIGWKIASLTAHCFALICSLSSLIILFFAFCHRLLVCVAAVLVTLAVITALIGNTVYFMFANYQDNNIIKEEDGIYEQWFGWSFYASILGNALLLIASVLGCMATTAILSARRTKLVKIEVDDGDDNARLIHIQRSSNGPSGSGSDSSQFKRSYSAVYKIDSAALRKWEKNTMKNVARTDFKRTNSMPNIKKGILHQRTMSSSILQSSTDISKAFTDPPRQFIPSANRKLAANVTRAESPEDDMIYEYVDQHSMSLNSTLKLNPEVPTSRSTANLVTAMHTYDRVPSECYSQNSRTHLLQAEADNEYLKPKSISSRSESSIHMADLPAQTTSGIQQLPSLPRNLYEREIYERQEADRITTKFNAFAPIREQREPLFAPEQRSSPRPEPLFSSPMRPKIPPKPPQRSSQYSGETVPSAPALTFKPPPKREGIQINTFQGDNGKNGNSRSITNLVDVGSDRSTVSAFDRRESTDMTSTPGSLISDYSPFKQSAVLSPLNLRSFGVKETSFNTVTGAPYLGRYTPSEMDRSVGSTATYVANSPAYEMLSEAGTPTAAHTGYRFQRGDGAPGSSSRTIV
ncbi:clc-like domain-containing protein [Ditylenchus destructor]|uniref:Clc-like domain-containing protein n=1 Tax=Ditylenchus destructor TaxID=166010 RepID=A0AAD4NJ65_9BILA|nr:clc-like domain-containing protein [Ditylenchus destructor]